MKYLALLVLIAGCVNSPRYKNGECGVISGFTGLDHFKVLRFDNTRYLVHIYPDNEIRIESQQHFDEYSIKEDCKNLPELKK